ncbi:MAG TPA: MarR family transcriptional regulator [Acidimicrobiales bacterium]|nr:MarR family transcriptional regulator [Acidimicrobiales bacterium]
MAPTSAPLKARRGSTDGAERLRRVVARLGRALRLTHVDATLSPSQREVLSTIVRRGPLRLSELAAEEGLNPTMLSRIVGHLEAAKLVTRTPDAKDARVVHLAVTTEGSALHDEIKRERTEALIVALDQLTKDERQAVLSALPALERLDEELRTRIL